MEKSPNQQSSSQLSTASIPRARSPRGFLDRRSADLALERHIVEVVSDVYTRYGFEPLDTGTLEYADALGRFLPDDDRPNDGVFALKDDDGQWLALRYDLTAPLARFVAANWDNLPKPFRRYSIGTVWRNEKPGPGRFREFVQCDADTVGSARVEADAEVIAMALDGLGALKLDIEAVVRINNRKLLNGLLNSVGITHYAQVLGTLRAIDKFDRLGLHGVKKLLGEGRVDESGAFTPGAQLSTAAIDRILEFLELRGGSRAATLDCIANVIGGSKEGDIGLTELGRIDEALSYLGVGNDAAYFDATIVRGLEYYNGIVFEAELTRVPIDAKGGPVRVGSIASGGRYDRLVERFGSGPIPATGVSFGISRLAAAIKLAGQASAIQARGPVVVLAFEDSQMFTYHSVAAELRDSGIAAEVYLGTSGLKAQLKYADRRLSPAVVIIGENERATGSVTIKDLDLGRALAANFADNESWRAHRPGQITVARNSLVETLKRMLKQN